MIKVVLLTSQIAPFQLELARAMNEANLGVFYHVIFMLAENLRPPHWLDLEDDIQSFSSIAPKNIGSKELVEWAVSRMVCIKPDVILVGGVRGNQAKAGLKYRSKVDPKVSIGMWMEPPLVESSWFRGFIKRIDYLWRLRQVDFVLAIGDRAYDYYIGCNVNTHFVPYGSDLSVCFALSLPKADDGRIRFLFSGGLERRHNFPVIMSSFEQLVSLRGASFELVISGNGPEQAVIDSAIARTPALAPLVRYDRVFDRWALRLKPFLESHVFIYPTQHAGWGLVIPEAMSAGCTIIASRFSEAARYLVVDDVNGFFVEPTTESLLASLLRCVDDPKLVSRMGMSAREAARVCDAPFVAAQLRDALCKEIEKKGIVL